MKKVYKVGFLVMIMAMTTSCLKQDLPDYPLWDGSQITNVFVEYRFESSDDYGNDPVVAYKKLDVQQTIDTVNATIHINISVPGAANKFTEEERAKVNQEKLWMYVDISTAATIEPIDGTPALGDPVNLKNALHYRVTAANGNKQEWSIITDSFTK